MPETCPHCDAPIVSERRDTEDGPVEIWRCEDCEASWRHPDETIMNRDLDFTASGDGNDPPATDPW
jgi:ribosomal protein L37AE/L43A